MSSSAHSVSVDDSEMGHEFLLHFEAVSMVLSVARFSKSLVFSCCFQAERGEDGAALWSHVRVVAIVIMQDRPGETLASSWRGVSSEGGGQPARVG